MTSLVQVVGFGPASLGLPVSADRLGIIETLFRQGMLFVDSHSCWEHIEESRLHYLIPSNSIGADFICGIYPFGTFAASLQSPAYTRIAAQGREPVPLQWVTGLLRNLQDNLLQRMQNYPRCAVRLGKRVRNVCQQRDGTFISFDDGGEPIAQTKCVVLATGGAEKTLPERSTNPVLLSNAVLRGHFGDLENWINEGRRILIRGGSHSGYSVAYVLLRHFGNRLAARQVAIAARNTKLYYRSMLDACADNYCFQGLDLYPETFEVNKFNGLRGAAKDVHQSIVRGKEIRVYLQANASAPISANDVVVHALGYRTREVPFMNAEGAPIPLRKQGGMVCVSSHSEVLQENGAPLKGVFGLGLGYAPVDARGERQVGLNFFHGDHAERIVRRIQDFAVHEDLSRSSIDARI
jgi:hypothetical protein